VKSVLVCQGCLFLSECESKGWKRESCGVVVECMKGGFKGRENLEGMGEKWTSRCICWGN